MRRVLAIGLDAASWPQLERWVRAGRLPALGRLLSRGRRWPVRQPWAYRAELAWTEFAMAADPRRAGYWGTVAYDPARYAVRQAGALSAPPFWSGDGSPTTVAFDIPHVTVDPGVEGVQVTAWGAHSPQYPPASAPAGLHGELTRRFGAHPAVRSDSEPGWYHDGYGEALAAGLVEGAFRRAAAFRWLLGQRPDWALALVAFCEPHPAGHVFWHGVDPAHPAHRLGGAEAASSRLLRVYQAVDAAVGQILDDVARTDSVSAGASGGGTTVAVFSVHDIRPNTGDVPAMFLVPELLHRLEGRRPVLVDPGPAVLRRARRTSGLVLPRRARSVGAHVESLLALPPPWRRPDDEAGSMDRLWRAARRARGAVAAPRRPWWVLDERPFDEQPVGPAGTAGTAGTAGVAGTAAAVDDLGYQGPTWYQQWWPTMRAFALPTFSDPHLRVNLEGREASGVVARSDYRQELDRLESVLRACRDPRTGGPLVAEVERPRAADPFDPCGPPADLVVRIAQPADTLVHPTVGRIGPHPFLRTGEHGTEGFVVLVPPEGCPLAGDVYPDRDLAPAELGGGLLALLAAPGGARHAPVG